jgi:pyruvate formate lyase activating enzyme
MNTTENVILDGISDFNSFSTVDCPEGISFVIFLSGCPNKCTFCHNKHLWKKHSNYTWEHVFEEIKKRKKLIDYVIFSGGEPTIYDLNNALKQVREIGLKTGLHTSGWDENCTLDLDLVDWIGLDYKAPMFLPTDNIERGKFAFNLTKNNAYQTNLRLTLMELFFKKNKVQLEIRTTLCKELIDNIDILKSMIFDLLQLKDLIDNKRSYFDFSYVLQACRDEDLNIIDGFHEVIKDEQLLALCKGICHNFSIRK